MFVYLADIDEKLATSPREMECFIAQERCALIEAPPLLLLCPSPAAQTQPHHPIVRDSTDSAVPPFLVYIVSRPRPASGHGTFLCRYMNLFSR